MIYTVSQKTRPLRLIWHNFTNSQHLLIIFGRETDLIQFSTDYSFCRTILVFPYQIAWQYSEGNSPNWGIECRLGRQKSRLWANIWLHCVLWSIPAASAIHLAAMNHGKFITLVAGKRQSLLMVGNNDEVYDKKSQCYTEDNITQW